MDTHPPLARRPPLPGDAADEPTASRDRSTGRHSPVHVHLHDSLSYHILHPPSSIAIRFRPAFQASPSRTFTLHTLSCSPSTTSAMPSLVSPSLVVLLALLASVLLVSLPPASGQPGCFPCVVSSCASYFNGSAPNVSIGATASSIAAAECNTLNTDIGLFISTAQGAACQANVAQLACQVIATVNATEVNCNTSSIGVGTPFGNQTYFQQRCSSAVSCLGYTYQDEVNAANACNSFSTFLGTIIAQPTPSTVACAPCNITSCYGLSTIGVTDVTFWAGSLPGLSGFACPAQQAVASALLAGGNAAVPASAVQQAVCNPLAALTLPQAGDTQAACNAGLLDQVFDGIIFNGASQMNMTWTQDCLATIPQLFQPALATNLINANYCTSPSLGLTNYANKFLLSNSSQSSSSTGGGAPTPSGGAGCFPCVVSSCATFFNGSAPKVSIGATASSIRGCGVQHAEHRHRPVHLHRAGRRVSGERGAVGLSGDRHCERYGGELQHVVHRRGHTVRQSDVLPAAMQLGPSAAWATPTRTRSTLPTLATPSPPSWVPSSLSLLLLLCPAPRATLRPATACPPSE